MSPRPLSLQRCRDAAQHEAATELFLAAGRPGEALALLVRRMSDLVATAPEGEVRKQNTRMFTMPVLGCDSHRTCMCRWATVDRHLTPSPHPLPRSA